MTIDHVQVGDAVYALDLEPYPLIDEGRIVDFVVNHPRETIQISDHLNSLERTAVASHAVSYAWKSLPLALPIPFEGSVE